MEQKDNEERQEHKDHLGNLVHQVLEEKLDGMDNLDLQVILEKMDSVDHREEKGFKVQWVHQDHLE
jgi:hypothetical protein